MVVGEVSQFECAARTEQAAETFFGRPLKASGLGVGCR